VDVRAVRHVELSDVAVEERDRVSLVILEYVGNDDRGVTLGKAGDRPVGVL